MKSKMLLFIFLSLILSLFAFEWENPVLVDQTHEIRDNTATVQMPTGYVSVWIDNRSGNDQLFAQYIDNDLNKRWDSEGLLISDHVSNNQVNIYKSDNHSVIIQWENSTLDDNLEIIKTFYYKRIDLWGNTIWEHCFNDQFLGIAPIVIFDHLDGMYLYSGEHIDEIIYINSQGDVSHPFSNNTTVFSDLKVSESNDFYFITRENYTYNLQKYNSNHQLEWEIDYPYMNINSTDIYLMPDHSVIFATSSCSNCVKVNKNLQSKGCYFLT